MLKDSNVCESILEAVGFTPLVRLAKFSDETKRNIYAKIEGLNPGGSIKTRTAINIIKDAERRGILDKDSIILEYTSGNQGVGLALAAAVLGYGCVIVMPECMSVERKQLIRAYGADVISTKAGESIVEAFGLAKKTALELAANDRRYFLSDQFENPANCEAHYNGTAKEIIEQLGAIRPDAFVAAVGTGGSVTGCGRRLREVYPEIKIAAAEPENSAVLSGGKLGIHGQQGIGDGFIPAILDVRCFHDVVVVSDEDAFLTARGLARQEGIFCGISSGTNVFAAVKYAKSLPEGSHVVTICPDLGDRYLSVDGFIK